MNQLERTLTSIEVAEMIGKEHSKVLRDIRNYIDQGAEAKIGLGDYFMESTYLDANNQSRPCFNVTKKGCEFIASKMNGPKGTEFSVKFINRFHDMEDKLQTLPTGSELIALAVIEAQKQLAALSEQNQMLEIEVKVKDQQINEMRPKTTYYDLVLQSNSVMPISIIAKDYGMGAPTLNKKLHEYGVQYEQSGVWLLYAKYQDKGYTQTKTTTYQKKDGTPGTRPHTQWTQKGRLFIYDILKQNGILPTVEREERTE